MKFCIERIDRTGEIRFHGSLSSYDIDRIKLDRLEQACLTSEHKCASDFLHDLEILFRRHEEQLRMIAQEEAA